MIQPVIVAGGGIGGLSAARALHGRGIAVQILEAAKSCPTVGLGMVIASGGMGVLAALGLAEAVQQRGTVLLGAEIRSPNGALLQRLPLDSVGRDVGQPTVYISRNAFLDVLQRQTGFEIVFGARVLGFTQQTARVLVLTDYGREYSASILIGADGLHSQVRAQMWAGETPAKFAGYACWRGVASFAGTPGLPFEPHTALQVWGPGCRFGAMPLGGHHVEWFAEAPSLPGKVLSGEAGHAEVSRLCDSWRGPMGAILSATPAASVAYEDIYFRHPTMPWGQDDVTLLGDAAHPTAPNAGLGTSMALEDAAVLCDALVRFGPNATALRWYEKSRQRRVARAAQRAHSMGQAAQYGHPLRRCLRDLWLRATPGWWVARAGRRWLSFDIPK